MKKVELKLLASRLRSVPTLSPVGCKLLEITADETATVDQVAEIIESDQSLTSRLLTLVNSPAYGFAGRVTSVSNAVSLLGFSAVRNLVLSLAVSDMFPIRDSGAEFDRGEFWKHSLACAVISELVAREIGADCVQDAFVAGLLHDIGKVVLDACSPEDFESAVRTTKEEDLYIIEAERKILSTDHTSVGKWVSERWGLPDIFTQTIWLHHQPLGTLSDSAFARELVEIVYLANVTARSLMIGSSGDYKTYASPEELIEHFNISGEQLASIKSEAYKTVEDRAGILSIEVGEGELAFECLEKANRALGQINEHVDLQNRELSRRADRLEVLHEMNTRILPGATIEEMLRVVADSLRSGMGVTRGYCLVADISKGILHASAWSGQDAEPQVLALPLAGNGQDSLEPFDKDVFDTVKTTTFGTNGASWVGEEIMEVIKRNDLTIVPMVSGGKSYGQIIVDHRSAESALADTHVAELLTFASAAGVAVSRQDLREKLNERSEELASAIWRQELAHRQLLRSERLASVGKMAAGAAHEINNPLAVISGRAQMLLKAEKDEKRAASLKLIVEQTHRASKILTDLMGFARPAMPKAEPVNLNTIVHQVLSMVENQLRLKNIEVARDLAEGLPRILADRRQLEQVFLNLVLNADHAMEDGGVLTVRTSLSKDGKQVVAKFTDTGVGIPKEHLAQIFEPFYTTKEEGKGTGLGLSMSYGIIKSHEGTIAADSAVGKGTTFTIKLPVPVDLKATVEPEKPEPQPEAKNETNGSATILVVDDEEYIRDILSETFNACGYRMLSAANGVEALKILNKESVDVVLLDIRMPMKDGLSVVKEIADRLPTLPVIIVTGLASDDEVKEAEKGGVFSCIRKPFEIQKLIEEVQKALRQKGSEPAD